MKGDGFLTGEHAAEVPPKANRGAEQNRSSGAAGEILQPSGSSLVALRAVKPLLHF